MNERKRLLDILVANWREIQKLRKSGMTFRVICPVLETQLGFTRNDSAWCQIDKRVYNKIQAGHLMPANALPDSGMLQRKRDDARHS